MNFFFKLFLLAVLLQGCFSSEKKDIISVTINKEKLQQDISILRGIIMDMHAGAYPYNTPEQLDNLFDSISNSITEPISTREFYNKAAYIIDRLKCIHSEVMLSDEYYDSIENKSLFFPMPLIEINNKLYVNSEVFTIPLAAEILSVNSNPANKIINKMGIYRHTDGNRDVIKENMIDEDFSMNYYMAYGGAAAFIIKYKTYKNDTVRTVTFTADKLQTIYKDQYDDTYFFYPADAPYDFEILNKKKTAILTVRSFSYATKAKDDAYNHFIENAFRMIQQNKIKNLVIDCRNNDGGYYSNTFLLLSYLVNKKMVEFDSAVKRFDKFTYTTFVDTDDTAKIADEDSSTNKFTEIRKGVYSLKADEITTWEPNSTCHFDGRLFIIVNSHVISAASTFAAILKDKTKAIIIGEETGGGYAAHNSSIITFILPNSHLKVNVPTQRFYQPVKDLQPGRGVLPHKYIGFGVEDLIDKNDRPMDYIFDTLLHN